MTTWIIAFVWVFWEIVFDISEIEDDTVRCFSLLLLLGVVFVRQVFPSGK